MSSTNSPLGKGLSALLTSTDPQILIETRVKSAFIPDADITLIDPNPYQPRVNVSENIDDLVASVKENGLIMPLIVTNLENGRFGLIAGERRLTASKLAGLKTVPVIIKEAAGEKLLEMAIIENIQRKDLNPIEEALAYKQLKEEFHMSVYAMSKKLGVVDQLIFDRLVLLELPDYVQESIIKQQMSMFQAVQLLPLVEAPELLKTAYDLCIKNQLSAKQLSAIVEKLAAGLSLGRVKKIHDDKTRDMEIAFTKLIGRKIYFTRTEKGGKIIISFNNDEELDEIYKRFSYIGYHV